MNPDKITLIATCIFGVEALLAGELRKLGYDQISVENGRVLFVCALRDIPRANINLRTAERVLLYVDDFRAENFDQLFEGIRSIKWSTYLDRHAAFPVDVTSIDSELFAINACRSVIKKAVVESMIPSYGIRRFPEDGSLIRIMVSIRNNRVTVALDTTGTGLHKRGYRRLTSEAPLKETLAAAMIMISRWKPDRTLFDPMCGTGTIPIEAAMIAADQAPGIHRTFSSCDWHFLTDQYWQAARAEAQDRVVGFSKTDIQGTDIDEKSLSKALYHAKRAGVDEWIHFQKRSFHEISSSKQYGFIITNPPYGERLGDKEESEKLYHTMGEVFQSFPTWSKYVLTPNKQFEKIIGRPANKRRKLYNGMIECTYYQYYGRKPKYNG